MTILPVRKQRPSKVARFTCGISGILCLSLGWTAHAAGRHGEILWDRYGVPHVYATSEADAFRGFGWAQAHSHGDVILRLYALARGRGSEYWGAEHLAEDRWTLSHGIPERAAHWYRLQTPAFRADLDAFAAGINAYAEAHPDALDAEVRRVLPVSGTDVIAHALRLVNYVYIASPQRTLGEEPAGGSNAWAVAPSRSASGNAMLLANPHLPWAPGRYTYFEAQITAPGFSIYGATQVGLPIIRFAFTDKLGFTNTVNTIQGSTSYRLTLRDGGYLFDGKVRPFETRERELQVREPDGRLRAERLTIRSTIHGPAFVLADGSMVAVHVAGLDRPGMLQQYFDMARASGLDEFVAILRRMQIPMFNIVYADRDGHILYMDNGILPRRGQGDFASWSKPVAGDRSDMLVGEIHGYDDLPKVIDPPSGFVQNANDPPWTPTWPQPYRPSDFPAYVAPAGPMSMRAQMSVRQLRGSGRLSFDNLVARKHDTTALMVERVLPALLPAALGSADPLIREAGVVLAAWDGRFEADARGALLFENWARLFMGPRFAEDASFALRWDPAAPIDTPDGIVDMALALRQLKQAAETSIADYGALDRPFGEVSRFAVGGVDRPGNGGFGNLGVFRTITWGPLRNGRRTPVAGETWVAMIEFGPKIRAMGVMSYGNSSQPGSPHRGDQIDLISRKQLRTLWIERAQVEANLEARTDY
jgi:acyl-homoserine-lactone acylase